MRQCKECGKPIYEGQGYSSGLGIVIKTGSGDFGGGDLYCSKKCYEEALAAGRASPGCLASLVKFPFRVAGWLIKVFFRILGFVFRKIIFTKFFWKYIAPVIGVLIGISMFLAHLEFVRKCEEEMSQYSEKAAREEEEAVAALKQERKAYLVTKEKQRVEEERRAKEEMERQKAELAAARFAAQKEALRQKIAQDMDLFAKEKLPDKWSRLKKLKEEISLLEKKMRKTQSEEEWASLEESEEGSALMKKRNCLIREKRYLELEIENSFKNNK